MSAIARKSAAPVKASAFDVETDVVVVGGGAGGLATALFSRWQGNEVVLIEKADELGGTTQEGRLLVLGAEQQAHAGQSASRTARRTASATWRGCRARKPTTPTMRASA